jgi:hypothetical protein
VRLVAEGAVRHAILATDGAPSNAFGFHSGRVGVAYVAARTAVATQDSEFFDAAQRALEPLYGHEAEDRGVDVIGGAAGAIPVLLLLAQQLDLPRARASACALGQALVCAANRGPVGWSWRGAPTQVRDLLGLAHGASGFAHALLELALVTHEDVFLYGAMQAFAYERHFFDACEANWPDFRHHTLGTVLQEAKTKAALRERLMSREIIPAYNYRCISTWCHGAPGIGLVRARAYQSIGEATFAHEAAVAADTSLASVIATTTNHSLCHGSLGNCETLFAASRALHVRQWADAAKRFVDNVADQIGLGGAKWLSGAVGGGWDPSLMVGEAGMGLFLLRMADASVPSVLLPESASHRPWPGLEKCGQPLLGVVGANSERCCEEDIRRYFKRTIGVFRRLHRDESMVPSAKYRAAECGEPLLFALRNEILREIERESDPQALRHMRDAAQVEVVRFDEALGLSDQTVSQLTQITRLPPADINWDTSSFALTEGTKLIEGEWDWDAYLDRDCDDEPNELQVFHVVHECAGYVQARPVGPLLALILKAVEQPLTLDELIIRVRHHLDSQLHPNEPERATLDNKLLGTKVKAQLVVAYSAGLLDATPAPEVLTAF